jgi:hypothetical protein
MATIKKFGDRLSVWEGMASMTRGGLTKEDLVQSKNGKLVSRKKSEIARANYAKFGFAKRKVEEEPKKKRKRRKKKAKQSEQEE